MTRHQFWLYYAGAVIGLIILSGAGFAWWKYQRPTSVLADCENTTRSLYSSKLETAKQDIEIVSKSLHVATSEEVQAYKDKVNQAVAAGKAAKQRKDDSRKARVTAYCKDQYTIGGYASQSYIDNCIAEDGFKVKLPGDEVSQSKWSFSILDNSVDSDAYNAVMTGTIEPNTQENIDLNKKEVSNKIEENLSKEREEANSICRSVKGI